jgi:hypothetical protein
MPYAGLPFLAATLISSISVLSSRSTWWGSALEFTTIGAALLSALVFYFTSTARNAKGFSSLLFYSAAIAAAIAATIPLLGFRVPFISPALIGAVILTLSLERSMLLQVLGMLAVVALMLFFDPIAGLCLAAALTVIFVVRVSRKDGIPILALVAIVAMLAAFLLGWRGIGNPERIGPEDAFSAVVVDATSSLPTLLFGTGPGTLVDRPMPPPASFPFVDQGPFADTGVPGYALLLNAFGVVGLAAFLFPVYIGMRLRSVSPRAKLFAVSLPLLFLIAPSGGADAIMSAAALGFLFALSSGESPGDGPARVRPFLACTLLAVAGLASWLLLYQSLAFANYAGALFAKETNPPHAAMLYANASKFWPSVGYTASAAFGALDGAVHLIEHRIDASDAELALTLIKNAQLESEAAILEDRDSVAARFAKVWAYIARLSFDDRDAQPQEVWRQTEESLVELERIMPGFPEARYLRGLFEIIRGDRAAAGYQFYRTLELDPGHEGAYKLWRSMQTTPTPVSTTSPESL